jgi:hypothetical protein
LHAVMDKLMESEGKSVDVYVGHPHPPLTPEDQFWLITDSPGAFPLLRPG